jgi:two-component system sensor histidine kinase GlrK
MIENLLGFSCNPTRSLRGETRVDLQEMIEALLQDHRAVVLKKNLQIKTRLRPGELTVDRDRLRTVLDNLLSNAVKYTPCGGQVEIAVRSAGDETLIDVSDSGPGVDETEKEKIFEPFFQGSAPCLGPVQGTGLGLSIVQEYVDELNGWIELEKSCTGGALFRIHLPMKMEPLHE